MPIGPNDDIDIKGFVERFLGAIDDQNKVLDHEKKTVIWSEQIDTEERYLSCIIRSGDYGHERVMYNITNEESTVVPPDTAVTVPFYVSLQVQDMRVPTRALLLMQRIGGEGIKEPFQRAFERYFQEQFPDHVIDWEYCIANSLFGEYVKRGMLKKLIFKYRQPPDDTAEGMDIPDNVGSVEVRYNATRSGYLERLPWIENQLQRKQAEGVAFLDDKNLVSVRAEVELDKTRRSIDLKDPRAGFTADWLAKEDDLIFDKKTGLPTYDSLNAYCKILAAQILKEMRMV